MLLSEKNKKGFHKVNLLLLEVRALCEDYEMMPYVGPLEKIHEEMQRDYGKK